MFPDVDTAVRARMQANALDEATARLLVERGLVPVPAQPGIAAGHAWSSDPRLTLPTMVRMTEAQVRDLVRGIECPTLVLHGDPPQPYLPEPLRSERAALLPRGELRVMAGGHHLHMDQPEAVAAVVQPFLGISPD